MKEILKVNNLIKKFPKAGGEIDDADAISVLKGINFDVEQGEYVGIMGKSGCGKTTLLKILGFMDQQTDGDVIFDGVNTNELWKEELTDIRRRKIGFVFQDFLEGKNIVHLTEKEISAFRRKNLGFVFQDFNLLDSLSVKENIMLPVLLDKKEQKECEEKAEALEKQFGIEHLQEKNPYELSGGERQRVAICRALINDPSIIFADEPTGNLDSKSGKVVAEEFRKINEELGKTLLMVTHDPQMASRCKRVIFLKDGYVMNDVRKEGTEEEFYRTIIGEMEKF